MLAVILASQASTHAGHGPASLPVTALSPEEAESHFGPFALFASFDVPASSALTQKQFGWHPTAPGSSPTSTKATTSTRSGGARPAGRTSGTGKATAELLHQRGYQMIVTGQNPDTIAAAQKSLPEQIVVLRADARSLADTDQTSHAALSAAAGIGVENGYEQAPDSSRLDAVTSACGAGRTRSDSAERRLLGLVQRARIQG